MVSQVLQQAILNPNIPDIVGSFDRGRERQRVGKERQRAEQSRTLAGQALQGDAGSLDELKGVNPELALELGDHMQAQDARAVNDFIRDARIGAGMLQSGDTQGFLSFAKQRSQAVKSRGGNTTITDNMISLVEGGQPEAALRQMMAFTQSIDNSKLTSEERNRAALMKEVESGIDPITRKLKDTKDLTAIERAAAIELKLIAASGTSTAAERIAGTPGATDLIAGSEATIVGAKETAKGEAQIPTDLRKQTQKQNSNRITALSTNSKARSASVKKAKQFLKALESGKAHSGAARKAAQFIPGVFTSQGEFDERFNAFAEIAARQTLKASGETRPTDADVQGMKVAMFGVGRDENVNIQLLTDFINEQEDLDNELDELSAARRAGNLDTFTVGASQPAAQVPAQQVPAQQAPSQDFDLEYDPATGTFK